MDVERLKHGGSILSDEYFDRQRTCLLFLKMADERAKPPYSQVSNVPTEYAWPTLVKKDGDEMFDHYRHTLENLGNEKGLLGLIFNKLQNKFQDPPSCATISIDFFKPKRLS